jgi:hypothetical protein
MFSNLFFITLPNIRKYFFGIHFPEIHFPKKNYFSANKQGHWYDIGMALGRLKATLPGIRKAYVPSFSIESENKNIYGTFTFLNYVQFHMMQCSCITQNKCKDDDSSLSLLTVFRKKTVIILV